MQVLSKSFRLLLPLSQQLRTVLGSLDPRRLALSLWPSGLGLVGVTCSQRPFPSELSMFPPETYSAQPQSLSDAH